MSAAEGSSDSGSAMPQSVEPRIAEGPSALDPVAIIRGLFRRRDLIRQLTVRDLEQSWRGSFLGAAWTLLQPLLTFAVYALVFTVLFAPRRGPEGQDSLAYVLHLFCGLIVFWVFSDTVSRAPTLILGQPGYVKNVVFPLEVLPVTAFLSSLVNFVGGLVILLVSVGLAEQRLSATLWLLPLVLLPLFLGTLGVAWFLAALGVFVRDAVRAVTVGMQFVLYLSPVIWRVDWVPEKLRPLAMINPFTPVLEGARAVLIEGGTPSWLGLSLSALFGLAVFLMGHAWFSRARWGIADAL